MEDKEKEENEDSREAVIYKNKNRHEPITSLTSLNDPLEFVISQNPLDDLNESKSAIIHIKNTCKNSFCNCYVNCCVGHSIDFNTFLNTNKGIKYLFRSNSSITPDSCKCFFRKNIELVANFKSFTISKSEEITSNAGTLYAEMNKYDNFNCCNYKEEIVMPVSIIPEKRFVGKIILRPNKEKYCNACFLCIPCDLFDCFPDCSECCPENCCKCGCDCDDPNRCCCGICPRPNCCCCDPNRCCCGICPRPNCCCWDPNRCCCGLCPKDLCKCPKGNNSGTFNCCKCCECRIFEYSSEIYDSNNVLKYYIFYDGGCDCACKCLRRKLGLNFNICDIKKNIIATIKGSNNNDFGAFFDDSYTFEISFPSDATPELKLILLHGVFSLDTLCIY